MTDSAPILRQAPQYITYAEVITAARAAYENGTLLAVAMEQGRVPKHTCLYRDSATNCKCVIGAALTDETLDSLTYHQNGAILSMLIEDKIIETDDAAALIKLQRSHDDWMRSWSDGKATCLKALGLE